MSGVFLVFPVNSLLCSPCERFWTLLLCPFPDEPVINFTAISTGEIYIVNCCQNRLVHAIFDSNNSAVNHFSDCVVIITTYDLVLTFAVNNHLKILIMAIGLWFWSFIFHGIHDITITNNKIIQSIVHLLNWFLFCPFFFCVETILSKQLNWEQLCKTMRCNKQLYQHLEEAS